MVVDTVVDAPTEPVGHDDVPPPTGPPEPRRARRLPPWRNPWRRPWILEGVTWVYLVWSIVPIGIAVLFSFNAGKSQSVWQGFSTRWYCCNPINSVFRNPQLQEAVFQTIRLSVWTTLIAVPLGVAFAIGINRWRTRTSTAFNFVMVFSYVIPELIFAVALFFLFTQLFTSVHLGTLAEVLGLVTWNFSWPAIIVLARLVSIGGSYEEAAADLGASRLQGIYRVLLPLLMPAVFAERRPGVRQRRGRLRGGRPPVLDGEHPADVGLHLLDHPRWERRPRAQRAGHDHAGPVLRRCRHRTGCLPLDDTG